MSKIKSLFPNILLLLFSSLLTLILGIATLEAYAWLKWDKSQNWHDPNTQFDSELGWSPIHNNDMDQWGGVRSNSLGFRSPNVNPEKESILIIGDSVAWGFGVSDNETISHYLQKIIDKKYQVQNLGVSGFGLDQDYLFLKRNIQHFPKPRWIVQIIYTGNDLEDTASNTRYGKSKPLFVIENDTLKLTNSPISKFNLRNLASKSGLIKRIQNINPYTTAAYGAWAGDRTLEEKETLTVIRLLLKEVHDLASSHGAKLMLVLSPKMSDLDQKSKDFTELKNVVTSENYQQLDLLERFSQQPEEIDKLFSHNDIAHYSAMGNHMVAEEIAKKLDL